MAARTNKAEIINSNQCMGAIPLGFGSQTITPGVLASNCGS
jgi:hypothetical protein